MWARLQLHMLMRATTLDSIKRFDKRKQQRPTIGSELDTLPIIRTYSWISPNGPALTTHGSLDLIQEIQIQICPKGHLPLTAISLMRPVCFWLCNTFPIKTTVISGQLSYTATHFWSPGWPLKDWFDCKLNQQYCKRVVKKPDEGVQHRKIQGSRFYLD
jgi:hypothetical protein